MYPRQLDNKIFYIVSAYLYRVLVGVGAAVPTDFKKNWFLKKDDFYALDFQKFHSRDTLLLIFRSLFENLHPQFEILTSAC